MVNFGKKPKNSVMFSDCDEIYLDKPRPCKLGYQPHALPVWLNIVLALIGISADSR